MSTTSTRNHEHPATSGSQQATPTLEIGPLQESLHGSADRGAQRSTRTNSPPSSAFSGAKISPRRTEAGQPARSSVHATAHASGWCHFTLLCEGSPTTQRRRHCVVLLWGFFHLDALLRGWSGTREQPAIRRKAHSRLTKAASFDSSRRDSPLGAL